MFNPRRQLLQRMESIDSRLEPSQDGPSPNLRRSQFEDNLNPSLGNGRLPLVSVIITSYNQARFLSHAIESVLTQTYSPFEIVVVDDGSTDNASQVVARYPAVRYIRQGNQGLSAARNTGLRESNGAYVVFLDADDRLLPVALETGVGCLQVHPECGFVSGHYSLIASDGSLMRRRQRQCVEQNHYQALLRGNYIAMHATVMYRRPIFASVGKFNTSLKACEDYDLYLRIARRVPVYCHDKVVAEYRQHDANMSRNHKLMLKSAVSVLQSQRKYIEGHKESEKAYQAGIKFWLTLFGDHLLTEVRRRLAHGEWRQAMREMLAMQQSYPENVGTFTSWVCRRVLYRLSQTLFRRAKTFLKSLPTPLYNWLCVWLKRYTSRPRVGRVRFGSLRRLTPISRAFGFDRGLPIDRYYIERFLSVHEADVRRNVLEIGDDTYTRRFGGDRVTKSDVLHVSEGNPKATIVGDLTRAAHIPPDSFDCVILTQTLHLIYDVRGALETLHRILKPGGVLLATFPGISQISDDRWRDSWHWAFTHLSARRLFEEIFPTTNVCVEVRGNVLTAIAFLHGLAAEELRQDELDYRDDHYEVSILVRAVKSGRSENVEVRSKPLENASQLPDPKRESMSCHGRV
jgi:glycosyltransferase involved in cell wall biosynthesis